MQERQRFGLRMKCRFSVGLWIVGMVAGVGCQKTAPPPKNPSPAPIVDAPVAEAQVDAAPVPSTGFHAIYVFSFKDSSGRVELWGDGPFFKVTETWESKAGGGRRWGAPEVALLFNADEQKLVVVNVSQKRFTRLDVDRMNRAREELAKERSGPRSSPILSGAVTADGQPLASPKPIDTPKRSHPDGCRVFHRALPFGLEEESCYRSLLDAGIAADAVSALLAYAEFTDGVSPQIGEMDVIAAIAEAARFGFGMVVSQHKFGVSLDIDQEGASEGGGLESWDRVITLESLEPATLTPEGLGVPTDAEEEYGLVPWHTPFFGVQGPATSKKK